MRLILASASPRRAELLRSAGYTFDVCSTDIDETPVPGEAAAPYARRVAEDKSRAARLSCRDSGDLILAADTVVVADAEILGKPVDSADARRMLRLLSGRVHDVHTAVVLSLDGQHRVELVTTRVHVMSLEEADIDWYIASGEPVGKAGAYAIQGRAARFIDRIEGSWSNVVGLPVATVARMLKEARLQIDPSCQPTIF
jgi:septum formation protein